VIAYGYYTIPDFGSGYDWRDVTIDGIDSGSRKKRFNERMTEKCS